MGQGRNQQAKLRNVTSPAASPPASPPTAGVSAAAAAPQPEPPPVDVGALTAPAAEEAVEETIVITLSPAQRKIIDVATKTHNILMGLRNNDPYWRKVREHNVHKSLAIMGALAVCRQILGMTDSPKFFPYNSLNALLGTERRLEQIVPNTVGQTDRPESAEARESRESLESLATLSDGGPVNVEALVQTEERSELEDNTHREPESLPVDELIVAMHDQIMQARTSDAWLTGKIGLHHENRVMIHGALALLRQLLGKRDNPPHFPYNTLDAFLKATDTSGRVRAAGGIPRKPSKRRPAGGIVPG